MKKYVGGILFSGMLLLGVSLLPSLSLAQSFLIASQGSIVASVATSSTATYQYAAFLGTGFGGSISHGFMTYTYTKVGAYAYGVGDLNIIRYTDSSYTTLATTTPCEFNNQYNGGANPDFMNGESSHLPPPTFVQLDPINKSFNTCTILPTDYVQIVATLGQNTSSVQDLVFYGTNTPNPSWGVSYAGNASSTQPFFPQFALTGGSFQITPTASSSGILLSGAVDFCNNALASSTGIGAVISNGLCVVTAFLFVPSAEAVQGFNNNQAILLSHEPFSWFAQTQALLTGMTASTSESNYVNLTLDFGSSTQALKMQKLTVISTSTLSQYYPDVIRNLAKDLIGFIFILLAMSFIYNEIKRIFNKPIV